MASRGSLFLGASHGTCETIQVLYTRYSRSDRVRVGLVSERESIKLLPPHVLHLPCRNDMDATRVMRMHAATAWTGMHVRVHRQGKPALPSGDPAP